MVAITQTVHFQYNGNSENALELALTLAACLISQNLTFHAMPTFPPICSWSTKWQFSKRKTIHSSADVKRGRVDAVGRGKWLKLQERKFTISTTQSFLAVRSISSGIGKMVDALSLEIVAEV